MFLENKDSVGELNIEKLKSNTSESDAITEIKNWCTKAWTEPWKFLLSIKKFCAYKPKTLYGLFRGEGKQNLLITDEEDYKILFALYKGTQKHLSLIPGANSWDNNDTGKNKVKSFCEEKLKTNPKKYFENKDEINNQLSVWCTKPDYKTVKEKIKKSDANWETITEEEDWKTAFEKWKHTDRVITAIKKSDGGESSSLTSGTDKNEGGPKMKKWCEDGMNKRLSDDGVYKEEYVLLKSACKKTN